MRKWMGERIKRRKPKTSPEVESTGKIGQPIDPTLPAALQPSYPDQIARPAAREPIEIDPPQPQTSGYEERAPLTPQPAQPSARADSGRASRPGNQRGGRQGQGRNAQWSRDRGGRAAAPPASTRSQAGSAARDVPGSPRASSQLPEANPQAGMQMETQPESPNAPPGAAGAATLAPPPKPTASTPRGVVVLAIGLPGSGKTTWFKRRGVTPLSSDMLRSILFDDITEQRYQGLVFSTLRSLLRARLIAKMPWNYVDASNLSPNERRQWIKMSRSYGYEVQGVFFDVPLEICLERNRKRERSVNEEVMHRMASKLKPPTFEEGFTKIVVVRVKSSVAPADDDPA